MKQKLIFAIILSIFLFSLIPIALSQCTACANKIVVSGTSGASNTCTIACNGACSANACVPGVTKGTYTGRADSYYDTTLCSSNTSLTYSIACSPYDATWGTSTSGNQYYCSNGVYYQCNSDCGGYTMKTCESSHCGADAQCNGVAPGTGDCDANCKYIACYSDFWKTWINNGAYCCHDIAAANPGTICPGGKPCYITCPTDALNGWQCVNGNLIPLDLSSYCTSDNYQSCTLNGLSGTQACKSNCQWDFCRLLPFSSLTYSADINYFNIFWTANHPYGENEQFGIKCWFNCDPRDASSCTSDCSFDESRCPTQRCTPYPVLQLPGPGSCTVSNPRYSYEASKDKILCVLYESANPSSNGWY